MSYLRRKADEYLKEWKKDINRYPLIIKGARQVGKTETIRKFARENYKNVIEINFFEEPKYKRITDDGYSADAVVRSISLIDPAKRFSESDTLIFFDEIQEFPEIATSLKFFKEDGRFDVICSGSLLGVQYKHIDSISVGYKTDYQMLSMDFEEFLWAKGYTQENIDQMLEKMLSVTAFTELEMTLYSSIFLEYCVLGGMPRIVSQFIERNTFEDSLATQRQLLADYEADIRKLAESLDQTRILSVYRSIPAQLAKENKKFQYNKVSKGGRSKDYLGCIEWLSDAGLINVCHCLQYPQLPLKGNVEESKFKLYMSDTGLLVALLDDEAQVDVRANKNLGVYKGALYENFMAEALTKQGYGLFYYKKENSTLEEDFFIRTANELIPVEVKAGSNSSQSMKQLINSNDYPEIHHGIKIKAGNIGYTNSVFTMPHFCAFLLKRFMNAQQLFN